MGVMSFFLSVHLRLDLLDHNLFKITIVTTNQFIIVDVHIST